MTKARIREDSIRSECSALGLRVARTTGAVRAASVILVVGLAAVLASSCGDDSSERRLSRERPLAAPEQAGPQLAFSRVITGNPPHYDIAVSDAHGRGVRVLTGDSKRGSVWPGWISAGAWSPDARRIAFTASLGNRGFSTDVYVMNADGSGARRLTNTRDARLPVWSPDGARSSSHGAES